ncbi:hypothetical protein CsSME_00019024 [Camellia sinensis var. sinensis]
MDDNVLSPSSKKQKLSEEHNIGKGIDMMSSLPENVLHHILSFLTTKEAIQTSILSRRWQYLWTSISNIDLNDMSSWSNRKKDKGKKKDCYPMCRSSFLDFVERVLLLHDASDIKRLRLRFTVVVNSSRLNSWISAAVRHNVEELDLSLPVQTRFVLPCCLFTCDSLVVLKLFMDCPFKPPIFIHFSNLKTLHLSAVTFSDDNSTQQLFSSCPVLQELELLYCGWKNLKTITISIPTLKRLAIENEPLRDDALSCVTKIYATNLISLKCTTNQKVDFHLCNLSSVVEAHIDLLYRFSVQQEVASCAINLVTGICNVETLTISNNTLSLMCVENVLDHLPTFDNMSCLELNEEFPGRLNGALMVLLEKSPKLEVLDFDMGFEPNASFDEVDLTLERVPSCFTSCLKAISITCFKGTPAEFHILRFLLKNATILEEMLICCSGNLPTDTNPEELSYHIQMLPRGSKNCVTKLLCYFCETS